MIKSLNVQEKKFWTKCLTKDFQLTYVFFYWNKCSSCTWRNASLPSAFSIQFLCTHYLIIVVPYTWSYISKTLDEYIWACLPGKINNGELLKLAKKKLSPWRLKWLYLLKLKHKLYLWQLKSSLWFTMHIGRITASGFKSTCHSRLHRHLLA